MKITFALVCILFIGCTPIKGKVTSNGSYDIYVEEVEGHKYVVYDGFHSGGIVHAESCPCKKAVAD